MNPTTTIYVPTPVETLEDAKALPHGTVAQVRLEDKDDWTFLALSDLKNPKQPGARFWFAPMSFAAYLDDAVVGGTALVPTEVEVEQLRETDGRHRSKTLYITPWQEEPR
ncbi:hypothetical protein [Brachybacterium paraconglomeratum]|uniref:hypothetical protein n=1 Tax=Brachybacterium paraconglomeratum TaxID=173362 RepID=UPI0022AF965E|nr:hypothetical protein [Brachybacterium paraconglomeratum]MCZ4325694.1 hypothetical protein [Brachybacterium paraconglomeratum]